MAEVPVASYMDQLRQLLPFSARELQSYLPDRFPRVRLGPLAFGGETRPQPPRTVLWKGFEKYHDGVQRLYLCLGLVDGFQVYQVDATNAVSRVVSQPDGPISFVKFIPLPGPSAGLHRGRLDGRRGGGQPQSKQHRKGKAKGPLLMVASATDRSEFPQTVVKIFSLSTGQYVHVLRFRSKVVSVSASPSVLAVVLAKEIHIFQNSATFDFLYSVRTFPAHESHGVLALGPRWLAYASCEPPPSSSPPSATPSPGASPAFVAGVAPSGPPPLSLAPPVSSAASLSSILTTSMSSSSTVLSNMGKDLATGLYTLGDMGRQRITSLLTGESRVSGDAQPAGVRPQADTGPPPIPGVVVVRDLVTQKPVTHFQAHSTPLAHMQFDPSGNLLVTTPRNGQYLHVYQVMAVPNTVEPVYTSRHLYRLFRGVTHADIRSLSFSGDSRWLAACSGRGTTHIFAINALGGPVDLESHGPPRLAARSYRHPFQVPGVLTLPAVHRIKQEPLGQTTTPSARAAYTPVVTAFHPLPTLDEAQAVPLQPRAQSTATATTRPASPPSSAKDAHVYTDCLTVSTPDEQLAMYSMGCRVLSSQHAKQLFPKESTETPPTESPAQSNGKPLELQLSPVASWDVCCAHDESPHATGAVCDYTDSTSETDAKETKPEAKTASRRWRSQVELNTYVLPSHEVPFWASPQFTLKTYQDALSYESTLHSLFLDDDAAKPMAYDKFRTFDGLKRINQPSPDAAEARSEPNLVAEDVQSALAAALEVSLASESKSEPNSTSRLDLRINEDYAAAPTRVPLSQSDPSDVGSLSQSPKKAAFVMIDRGVEMGPQEHYRFDFTPTVLQSQATETHDAQDVAQDGAANADEMPPMDPEPADATSNVTPSSPVARKESPFEVVPSFTASAGGSRKSKKKRKKRS